MPASALRDDYYCHLLRQMMPRDSCPPCHCYMSLLLFIDNTATLRAIAAIDGHYAIRPPRRRCLRCHARLFYDTAAFRRFAADAGRHFDYFDIFRHFAARHSRFFVDEIDDAATPLLRLMLYTPAASLISYHTKYVGAVS